MKIKSAPLTAGELYGLSKSERRRVRLIAIAMLKNQKPMVPLLPGILCLVFGAASVWPIAWIGKLTADVPLQMMIDLGVTVVCASVGGSVGWMILNHCIRPYMGVAVEILRAEKPGDIVRVTSQHVPPTSNSQ